MSERSSQKLNLIQACFFRRVRRHNVTGEYTRPPGKGCNRCTTPSNDQYLRLQSLRNRALTVPYLRNELLNMREKLMPCVLFSRVIKFDV